MLIGAFRRHRQAGLLARCLQAGKQRRNRPNLRCSGGARGGDLFTLAATTAAESGTQTRQTALPSNFESCGPVWAMFRARRPSTSFNPALPSRKSCWATGHLCARWRRCGELGCIRNRDMEPSCGKAGLSSTAIALRHLLLPDASMD